MESATARSVAEPPLAGHGRRRRGRREPRIKQRRTDDLERLDYGLGAPVTAPLLTVEQVAAMLRCSEQSVYRWAQEGRITRIKCGRLVRFDAGAVQEFVKKGGSNGSETKRR